MYYRINHGNSLQQTKTSDPTCICDALVSLRTELVSRGLFEKLKKSYNSVVVGNMLYNLRTLHERQAFEYLYHYIKKVLIEELYLTKSSAPFIKSVSEKDKEVFLDIGRLTVEDYMQKYELFGMKKPPEEVEEPEQKEQSVDNKTEPVIERLPLHQRVNNYYRNNGFWATCKKICSKLLKF